MKKIFTLFVAVLLTANVFAQAPQKMSFQAVIRNNNNALLTSTLIGMKISIVQGSDLGTVVYSETQSLTTNSNGLASLEIGNGSVVEGNFASINWANSPYFIKTETDPTGGTSYTISGMSELMSVPYALFSANGVAGKDGKDGIDGIAGIKGDKGDTGLQGLQGDKGDKGDKGDQDLSSYATNTALDTKVDKVTGERLINVAEITKLSNQSGTNTGDQDLSALATNANLDLKVDKVTGERLINAAEITKLSNQSGTNTGDQDLSALATNANLDLKVDKVAGERLINAAEITKLSNQSGTNTGDQDLSSYATNTNLALKANLASPTFTGTVSGITAAMVGLGNVDNTTDADKPVSTATNTALDTKVDKVTGERLINAAEITKLSNQSGTNTGDQDLSSYATNTNLALKANLASPTFTGTVSGITSTMVGLGNVDNTTDADKPVSTATNTALDTKVDKVTGERLINAAEITKLSNQSGTNTGDQDLSALATNANLDLKVDKVTGERLINAAEITKLSNQSGTNTGDQDLSALATNANLDLKVDKVAGERLINAAEITKLSNQSGTNTGDQDLSALATNANLDLKVDKVAGERLINAAEITKLSNQSGTNTGDQDLSSYATNTNLALKANLASPTFTGTVSGITSTMVGLGNVDNTTDLNKPVSTATNTALDTKVDKVTGERLINAAEITKLSNQSGTNTGDQDLSSYATNTNLALKANLASPTFTGTVSGITSTMVGLGNVDNTTDLNKPVSTATNTALDTKVDKVTGERLINAAEITKLSNQSGTNTGDQDLSALATNANLDLKVDKVTGERLINAAEITKLSNQSGTNTGDQDLSSYATNTNLALKANLASPTFTGTVSGIDKTMVGLGNVDNTTDADKPVSTATNTALDTKVDKVTGERLINAAEITKLSNQSGTNTGDQDLSSYATNTNLALKANLASPTFTGTVSGITSTMIGLGNVDNTTDLNKPVSTATNTALDTKVDKVTGERLINAAEITKLSNQSGTNTGDQDLSSYATNTNLALKANLASPTFTGTVSGITAAMVGLGNVDNTTDADKPVSTATNTALDTKVDKVTGERLINAAEITKLSNQSGTNTGDQDLSALATNANLDLKVDKVTGERLINAAEITKLSNQSGTNTGDQDLSALATNANLDLKVDKVTGERLINAAEITKLSNQSGTNTGDQDLSSYATNTNLALKANLASPTFTGTVSGITSTMVGLGNVDNTTDLNKPVSTATNTALDTKVDKVTGERLINAAEITKLSNQSGTNTGDQDLSSYATNTNLDLKVDKVAGARLINAAEITKLSNQSGTNTGDQDLSSYATNTNLALKANLASPTFTGTVSGITSTMVGLGNVDNTTDLNKPVSTATNTALDTKVDKVTGERLINAAEITKLSNQSGTNTGDQDLSSYATNTNLALKANLASPTFTGTVSGITSTMVGLGNVDNTTDADKPVSTATNTALDTKVDKVTGERLINAAEITKLSNQSGTNTGDQDLSALATNANLDLKVDKVTGERLINAAEITKLSNQSGTNTGDQDLSALATNANLDLKANLASPTFTGTVSGITSTMVGLGNVDNTTDADKPVSTATNTALDTKVDKVTGERLINAAEITKLSNQSGTNTGDQDLSSYATNTNLALKANLASPTFTGTVSGITSTMVGLGNVDNTTDADKPVSTATNTALDTKVDKVAGERLINAAEITKLSNQSGTNTGDQDLSSYATNTNLALKANLASPTFTGTVSGIDKTMVGLGNVDNTTDADKPVSTATNTALDTKVDKVTGERLINAAEITKLSNQSGTNTGDQDLSSYATNTNLALKANLASPTFTGTVSGITSTMIGLGNVDNTTDADKPVSTATNTALDTKVDKVTGERLINAAEITKLSNQSGTNTGDQDLSSYATNTNLALKANLASPTFTGTVSGITAAMVGLGNVDNTTDADKPVSTATNTALDTKVDKVTGERLINAAEITKLSNQSGTNTGDQDLSALATNANLDLKVDKVTGERLINAAEITKLSNQSGTNTGDQDLSALATNANLDLKVDKVTGERLINAAEITKLSNQSGTNTGDQDLSALATNANLDLKVDKVAGERLINAAEITKLSNQSGTNTGDQDLSSYATNTNLALKANLASPTFTGTVSGITSTMIGLGNVDNTTDLNKPVSTATNTALDTKVDKVTGERLINAAEITKLSNQSGTNTGDQDLSALATNANLDLKVDKVAGERLINAAEITKLSNQSGTNTGDQDLSSYATNTNLALKANLASPTFTGTVSGITSTMIGLGNVDNTTDLNKPVSTATNTALDTKVDKVTGERLINAAEITKLSNQSGTNTGDQDLSALATNANLDLKVDKVAGERLINAAEITKLSNQSGTNTGDQDLSSYATNTNLALKANLASPTFTGTVSGITSTMVGLGNVDNTTDADKPVSTATNTALDTKVDKVTGERLINAAEITKLSNQSGTNTGDQDLSALATNANLDLKVDKVAGERLINAAEITKLSNQSGTNTGDQDLSALATNANLDLKVDKVTGERLINAAEITKLSNQSGTNTGDQDLSALATNANLDLKVDKVAGERLINAAEITKLSNQSGTNTGDQDLSSYATNTNLALKANLASPTFTGTVSGITSTMVGLGNVDNTTDADKPVSTATNTALDTKVDKVTGERLINAAEINKLSNQSGTNTGDQDLSSYATNTNLALKANLASPTFTGTVSGITSTMVGLGNVDNTTDADKPVSTATNTALDTKVDKVTGERLINAAEITKLSNQSGTNTGDQDLSALATNANLDLKVDKVAGERLINAAEITKLSNQSGTNTGDQDLSALATNANLDLKVDKVTGERLINAAEITKLSNQSGTNTGDQDLSALATNANLDLKVDKVAGERLINAAEITKLSNQSGTNTGDQDLSSYATNTNLALKANLASPTFTGTVSGITSTMVGLGNVDNTTDADKPVSTATNTALDTKVDKVTGERLINAAEINKLSNQSGTNTGDQDLSSYATNTNLALKANLASPTFTGTVSGITAAMVGLGNVDNTTDADKPVSTATNTALDTKVDKVTGERLINAAEITKLSNQSGTNTGDQDLSSYATNTNLALKANLASPTFTGTVSGITSTMVGLGNVDNTTDADKPVSTATNTALDTKVDKVTGERLINAAEITKLSNQSGTNTGDQDLSSYATNTNLALKANLASPTFTGTVSGITSTMVGLGNVDNTTDADKPVSTATNTALDTKVDKVTGERLINAAEITKLSNQSGTNTGDQDLSSYATNTNLALKANLASPTFTGTVSGITAAMVGLGNVDNTTDADKPVSTATNTALDTKVDKVTGERLINAAEITKLSNQSGTNTGDQDLSSYATNTNLALKANLASPTFTGTVSGITSTMVGLGNVDNTTDADKPVSTATNTALDTKVDKVTGERLINAAEITKLSNQSGTNTGDQDLSALATNANLDLKVDKVTGERLINAAEITKLSNQSGTNTGDQDLSALATNANLDLKVDKVTGERLINAAEITKLSNQSGTNTGDQDLSALATNANLDLKAPLISPTFTGTPTLPTGTIGVTQAAGDNTTALATTAFVTDAVTTATNGAFVDLTTNQSIAGLKTFSSDLNVNGVTVGRGNSNENSNTAFGLGALGSNIGYTNTGIGTGALAVNENGDANTALGYAALTNNVSGKDNVAIGRSTLLKNVSGSSNTAIGKNADIANDGISNSIAIGANAIVTASNTIQLGSDGSGSHTAITDVKTSGSLTAAGYKIPSGTASQFLMADGSVSTVLEVADEFSATASQTSFTLTQTPSINSKVKMYINGIRISNTAYSSSGTTLTYVPANNGAYSLQIGDRIQFDYTY